MEFGWLFIVIFTVLIILGIVHIANLISGRSRETNENFRPKTPPAGSGQDSRIRQSPQQTANQNTATGAVGGTLIGAGLGNFADSTSLSAQEYQQVK